MSGYDEKVNTWKSKWITVPDDVDPEEFVICENCSYSLGILDRDITMDTLPKMCPKCKHDMENGKVREYAI